MRFDSFLKSKGTYLAATKRRRGRGWLCDGRGSENTPEQKIGVLDFLYSCDKFVIAVPAPLPQPLQLVCAAFSVGQPGLADVVRCMLALGAPPPGNLHTALAHLARTPATGY